MKLKAADYGTLNRLRESMIAILRRGSRTRRGLVRDLQASDPHWEKNFGPDGLYSIVCHAIRIYQADFYVDDATRRILLTLERKRLAWDAPHVARNIATRGMTGIAHSAAAMERLEEGHHGEV